MATKLNPTQAAFTAPAEHAAVVSYALEIQRVSDGAVMRTDALGKPAPNAQGDIVVPLVKTGLANNTDHVFFATAIGAANQAKSGASNPFAFADMVSAPTNVRAQ